MEHEWFVNNLQVVPKPDIYDGIYTEEGWSLFFMEALKYGHTVFIEDTDVFSYKEICLLVHLFQNKDINKNGQLIFTTQASSNNFERLFHKDQIWLMMKDYYNKSTILRSFDDSPFRFSPLAWPTKIIDPDEQEDFCIGEKRKLE